MDKNLKTVKKDSVDAGVPVFDASKLSLLIDGKPVNSNKFGFIDDGNTFIVDLFIGDEESVKRVINGKEFRIAYQYPKDYLGIYGVYDNSKSKLINKLVFDGSNAVMSIGFPIVGNLARVFFDGKA